MLNFDRYHATMGNFSLTEHARFPDGLLSDKQASFYVTQRKLPFAPCVGHERLKESLLTNNLDVPRLRFLRQDKADLSVLAARLSVSSDPFDIRAVKPGTIIFRGEPFADISGPFCLTQLQEVKFEHAFDEPITVAYRALQMRLAAGYRHLSGFSLRRDGSPERSMEINKYGFIGGLDDTSFMEAAYYLDINAVGTMAHYYIQAFQEFRHERWKDGKKHFEQVAFERWLDAHPKGTTLLLDAISLELGTAHAIKAAKSTPARGRALKAVRIDSGDLPVNAAWVKAMLETNGLSKVEIIVTSDLDEKKIKEIIQKCSAVNGFGVGTKLAAEVETVAGVIFKMCEIGYEPTMKLSETPGKETLPGLTQVWRIEDEQGFYIKDVITTNDELPLFAGKAALCRALIEPFFGENFPNPRIPSISEQKVFVMEQLRKFRDIDNYPVELSPILKQLIEKMRGELLQDEAYSEGISWV